MLGFTLDTKMILIAGAILIAVGLVVGAYAYHEATTAALRADLDKLRTANAAATERNGKLETLVRESSAEVEAANRAAEAARRQAERNACVSAAFDKARTSNRKAMNNAQNAPGSTIAPQAYGCEAYLDTRPLWGRLNELFGVCDACSSSAPDRSACAPGLPATAAP